MADERPPADASAQAHTGPVCFDNSKSCIPRTKPATRAGEGAQPRAALNLEIPKEKMREVAARVNATARDPDEEPVNYVEVRAQRDNTPDIPGGLASLFWASKHPSQAWRIFMPVTKD